MDIEELYKILYYLNTSKSLTEVADKLYYSNSKTSKKIKKYEEKLKIKIFDKTTDKIITDEAQAVLNNLTEPYFEMMSVINKKNELNGYDENLILDISNENMNIKFSDTYDLIKDFELGNLKSITISEDFEKDIKFKKKEFFINKKVFEARHKDSQKNIVYATSEGSAITEKLKTNNINIDVYLKQSIGVCNIIRAKKGIGYVFTYETLINEDIKIVEKPELGIKFYTYYK